MRREKGRRYPSLKLPGYSIDRVDFISLRQKARRQGISSRNILSVWRATGLIPYSPTVVFHKLSIRPHHTTADAMVAER